MRRTFQIIVSVTLLIFAFSNIGGGNVDFGIIALWLLTWLGSKRIAITYAVSAGLLFDLLSFLPFGYWTVLFIATVSLIDWLKTNFLPVSSYLQAVLVLIGVTIATHLSTALFVGSFNYLQTLTSIIANVLVGSIFYYLLVIRFKMFQRWTGQRL